MSAFSKTALYAGRADLPPLVAKAAARASHAPFDLLVLDGGGGVKRENDPPAEPARLLKPGGALVLDDFHPPMEYWPEEADTRDQYGRSVAVARKHWLEHPDLFAAEVRLTRGMSSIVATRKARRP